MAYFEYRGDNLFIAEPLHFHQNNTSRRQYLHGGHQRILVIKISKL
jgi:hypothetical protein